jgi:Protein of unknown function (DUF1592)/Protein of unknown function (DUF1588)/Protein of unknown function (DUF1595)/Protein of unknown function (DUF1587)/Protein of unknown function (DUF1585)
MQPLSSARKATTGSTRWVLSAVLVSGLAAACGSSIGADEGGNSGRATRAEADEPANRNDGGAAGDEGPSGAEDDVPAAQDDPDTEQPSGADDFGDDATGSTSDSDDPSMEPEPDDPPDDIIPPAPGESTRVARLTHAQYQNTVSELFGITDGPAGDFAPDALNGFQFQTSVDFRVDGRLGPQYREAAEGLAARVVNEPELSSRVLPCGDQSCAAEFISSFGRRAFRRPLEQDEAAAFLALFERGAELVGSGDAFLDGVQLVIEAMLQAPQFIYRTELGADVAADGTIVLSPYEVASRLSFFLYDSMPDQPLFDAAAAGELGTAAGVEAQVRRMLADPRATRNLVSFHEQAWRFSRYSRIAPDAAVFGDLPADLASRMSAASSRFIQEVIESGGGFVELLTAPYAFADDVLAPLYGASASELTRIDLDPSERKGYLMQVGFLASNAYSQKTDPIHRGLFVVRDLLCRTVPDPPANAAQTPFPADAPQPDTTREEITILTGQEACAGCHSTFNPAGYAFEGFDAVGQARTQENGVDVDTSGEMALDSAALTFDSALTLVDALAVSAEARRCYAGKWLQFAHGRTLTADELGAADALVGATSIEALVLSLVSTPGFLNRAPNEVAQ